MTRMLSFASLTGHGSSAKDTRMAIQIQGDQFISIEGKRIPVFYGTLERPSVILATVTLDADKECSGNNVEILYKASATYNAPVHSSYAAFVQGKQSFQKNRWLMDLSHPKEGKVAAGRYTKTISVTIDPLWPSSGKTAPHAVGQGWIEYVFEATFSKQQLGTTAPVLKESQEVWVLNSTLPPPSAGLLTSPEVRPFTIHASWKEMSLPVSLTFPAQMLAMGQVVPITVKMSPFASTSKFSNQNVVIVRADFSLKEKVDGRASGFRQTHENIRDVIKVPINDGWPRTAAPWERTVSLTMPVAPSVVASTKTRFLDIQHFIVLTMKLRAEGEKEFKAKEFEVKADVEIVVPRRSLEDSGDVLPVYALGPGQGQDNQQNTQLQYQDVKA